MLLVYGYRQAVRTALRGLQHLWGASDSVLTMANEGHAYLDNLLDRLSTEITVSSQLYVVLASVHEMSVTKKMFDVGINRAMCDALENFEKMHDGLPLSKVQEH